MKTLTTTQAPEATMIVTSKETVNVLRQFSPEHPALNRMRAKVMQTSGVQAISAYDRMHHRHSRS